MSIHHAGYLQTYARLHTRETKLRKEPNTLFISWHRDLYAENKGKSITQRKRKTGAKTIKCLRKS